ncbi:MAG: hypothetical protein EON92_07520, partial [Burkholderiales bacterium]
MAGYGIQVDGDGVTLSGFSLLGSSAGTYGIKAQPNSSDPNDRLLNLTIENVSVSGFGKSEIDLNGVVGATLANVTVNGQNTAGVGVGITDSADVTLTNVITSGNNWGGVALYSTNTYYNQQVTGIIFGAGNQFGETIKVYAEDRSGSQNLGTVTGLGDYQVKFGAGSSQPTTFFFANKSELDVFFATLSPAQKAGAVIDTPNGFDVRPGMLLQAAIDAASAGDVISVYGGDHHNSANYNPADGSNSGSNPVGLLINKSVTIQGVDANGAPITATAGIVAKIYSDVQSNWGTNFFVTAENVTITGLAFVAKDVGGEVNKAFEIVANNFTLANSSVGAAAGVEIGATIYLNDDVVPQPFNPATFVSDIAKVTITGNKLYGDVSITNGVGYGVVGPDLKITNNEFLLNPGSDTNYNWGIILTGRDDDVAWRVAPIALPTVTGNSFAPNYTADRLLYARDDDALRLPDAAYVTAFIAANDLGRYAYAKEPDGTLRISSTATSNGVSIFLSAGAASAAALPGDTLVVKSGAAAAVETIVTDNLKVDAQPGSADLDLVLGGGVITLTLLGSQNVDVTGNAGDNVFVGNAGNNRFDGDAGTDTVDFSAAAGAVNVNLDSESA